MFLLDSRSKPEVPVPEPGPEQVAVGGDIEEVLGDQDDEQAAVGVAPLAAAVLRLGAAPLL